MARTSAFQADDTGSIPVWCYFLCYQLKRKVITVMKYLVVLLAFVASCCFADIGLNEFSVKEKIKMVSGYNQQELSIPASDSFLQASLYPKCVKLLVASSNAINTLTFIDPQRTITTNNTKVLTAFLYSDDVWHCRFIENYSLVESSKVPGKMFVRFRFHFSHARRLLLGKRNTNIYLKPVEDHKVFKICLVKDGKRITDWVYSNTAISYFKNIESNKKFDSQMQDEFILDN